MGRTTQKTTQSCNTQGDEEGFNLRAFLLMECPHCHRALEDYVKTIPPNKHVSVDIPLDILESEWVLGLAELRAICKYLNENREGRVKFRGDNE